MQDLSVFSCVYEKKSVILQRKIERTNYYANFIYCIEGMIDVKKIWLTDAAVWIETADGRQACERFDNYASLRNASDKERQAYTRSPFGLHWPALDEDLSFEGFFASKEKNTYRATHAVA